MDKIKETIEKVKKNMPEGLPKALMIAGAIGLGMWAINKLEEIDNENARKKFQETEVKEESRSDLEGDDSQESIVELPDEDFNTIS